MPDGFETRELDDQNESLIVDETPPMQFPIEDAELLQIFRDKKSQTEKYYSDIGLKERREKFNNFYKGKHLDTDKMDDYQVPYVDNLIWRDLETRVSIAAGRMPDIVATPANRSEQSVSLSKEIEKSLDYRINSDFAQRLLKDGLRLNHLNLLAAIKVRWDKNEGKDGDYKYDLVRPSKLGVDPNATIPQDGFTADNMNYIYEYIDEPVNLVMSKFPKAKEKIRALFSVKNPTGKISASSIRYVEFWFSYYSEQGEKKEGVAWLYDNIVLDKNLNPYWDWEGVEKVSENMNDQGEYDVSETFQNFFNKPRKPYIFLSHQNLGEGPVDTTSPVEQAIPTQEVINKRGRQITEIADRAIPKLVFSTQYISKDDIARITQDPSEHIALDAQDIKQAFAIIPATPPNPILYNDLVSNRSEVDSMFSTHGTTRGEVQPQESGISKQITREGDLTIADDLVNIVVERTVYEMANWALQMMKMFYDKSHYVRHMGKDGEIVEVELTQDKIEDGIEVSVKASSTDKTERKTLAVELAKLKFTDPLTMLEDLDVPNPKERAERLMTFLMGEQDGFATYLAAIGIDIAKIQGKGQGGGGGAATGGAEKAQQDIEAILSGEDVQPEGIPDEEYLQTVMAYVKSPDFEQIDDGAKQKLLAYVQGLKQILEQTAGETPPAEAEPQNANIG